MRDAPQVMSRPFGIMTRPTGKGNGPAVRQRSRAADRDCMNTIAKPDPARRSPPGGAPRARARLGHAAGGQQDPRGGARARGPRRRAVAIWRKLPAGSAAEDQALADLPLTWHFIGRIQANKTAAIAEHFRLGASVDRLKIAERLSEQRPPHLPPLNICLQVNLSAARRARAARAARTAGAGRRRSPRCRRLRLRGLMTIPGAATIPPSSALPFARLRELHGRPARDVAARHAVHGHERRPGGRHRRRRHLVRIGTALFGPRGTEPGDSTHDRRRDDPQQLPSSAAATWPPA